MVGATSGPWKVWVHPNPGFGCEVRMAEPPTVETVTIAQHATPADAALIAAAPDMYTVLRHLEGFVTLGPTIKGRIRAALAKAEGKVPTW